MALLSLNDLKKCYGALVVTDGISLEVARVRSGLLGPNGARKTTLFNLIAGTVRPLPAGVASRAGIISTLGVAAASLGISRSFHILTPSVG